jgi:hypothetical protein
MPIKLRTIDSAEIDVSRTVETYRALLELEARLRCDRAAAADPATRLMRWLRRLASR